MSNDDTIKIDIDVRFCCSICLFIVKTISSYLPLLFRKSYVLIYFFCVFLQVVYLNMNFWLSVSVNLVSIFTLLFIVDLIIKKITKNDNYIQK